MQVLLGLSVHACAMKCEKYEEGKAYIVCWKSFEDVRAVLNCAEREDMVVTQEDHTLYLLRKVMLLSLVLIILEADFTAL